MNADIRDNAAGHHTTAWYAISDASHFIEIEWFAATAPGANNGYLSLWIDGALKETVSGIDNDARRVDEVRLGPNGGLDAGTSGTEYFDAFESRRQTYIGPAGPLADFSASPVQGIAPLTVTFTNASQPTSTITSYLWNFGDGYTSTITNPVHIYLANGHYTVALTAVTTVTQNTITKTNFITASDLIFADGFESGDMSAWSAAITNSGHLTVSPAAALVGNYGLQATIVNTTAMYVRDDTPAGEARYRARFYFDPNSITMAAGNEHIIFEGETAADVDSFRVWLKFSAGAYQLHANLIDDGSIYTSTALYPITDAPHFIETDWAAATAPGANNGYLSLWIDGVLKETVSGIDNDTQRIDDVRLGPSSGVDAGTSGTEYFDAFESRRQSYIGPASSVTLTTTTIRYTYDPLSRLTGATYSGAYTYTFAYVYDQVGNRTTQTATITSTMVTTYTYDAANRMTKVGTTNYTWDNNGNLTSDGSTLYRYDQANRLISTTIGTTTTLYSYNGDGVRLKQIIAGVPTTYTQDLAAPLPVVLQAKTGTIATQYLYNIGTHPLAQYTSSTWQYLLPDALGSVRQIADASGNILLTESYHPYGTLLSSSGSGSSIFGYAGEQFDVSTGLVFLRARYLQPTLGMFLSRDPASGTIMRPITYNGWIYAADDPIMRMDPSGQCDGCGGYGSFALVTGADAVFAGKGLPVRVYHRITASPVEYRVHDGKAVMIGSNTVQEDGIIWRSVLSPFPLGTFEGPLFGHAGWVNDDYLKGGGNLSDLESSSYNAVYYPPNLGNFMLGKVFPESNYWMINGYGSGGGYTDVLPDLDAQVGHNGVDVEPISMSDCPVTTEVLAPVDGTYTDFLEKNVTPSPGNPPGHTIHVDNIPGYPRLQVQLTHVLASKTGQATRGEVIGMYAKIGYSSEPHLHISMLWHDYDNRPWVFDPTPYIGWPLMPLDFE